MEKIQNKILNQLTEKIKGLIDYDNILSGIMMDFSIFRLFHGYFKLRGLEYPGDLPSIRYWKSNEPELYVLLLKYYSEKKDRKRSFLLENMTEIVTKPIGVYQRNDKIIAFIKKDTEKTITAGEKFHEEKSRLISEFGINEFEKH